MKQNEVKLDFLGWKCFYVLCPWLGTNLCDKQQPNNRGIAFFQDIANDVVANDAHEGDKDDYKIEIKWRNVFIFIYLHIAAIYGLYLPKQRSTVIIGWIIGILSGMGTTVGSHRLFTHRTFKANQALKILMMILQTMAGQEPVLKWARDHRVHHK